MASPVTTRRILRSARPQTVNVRTTVVKVERDDSTSKQIAFADEFLSMGGFVGAQTVLPTPYDIGKLFELIDQSNMLRQCIEAYVTNTVGTGWEVQAAVRERAISDFDRNELQSFIDHSNSDESLSATMRKVITDRESVGFGFLECIRDASGALALFRWAPSLYTRLCAKHDESQLVEYDIPRGQRVTSVKELRRFRRYIQIVNGQRRWFKEFGDPRRMDCDNGLFEGEDGYRPGREATELYHFRTGSNDSYGIPRWINQLPSILGSREAEEVNMRYFQDNTVPPMLLTVGGGRLTQGSYAELVKALNKDGVGKDRQNKIILLEAVGEGDSMGDKPTPVQLKVEKLSDVRQSDGLFKEYDQGNQSKVRSSFRLPPVLVGMSQDVNFATANVSAFVAESQVFAPARVEIDEVLNKQFVNGRSGLGLKSAKLASRTPSITSPEMLIKTLTALNVMGAVTPRSAQQAANTVLQMELPEYPKKGEEGYEEWMDQPIALTLKNGSTDPNADPAAGGDPALDEHGNPVPDHTQTEQSLKSPELKKTEKTGDPSQSAPKNGEQ